MSRILLVDDDLKLRQILEQLLRLKGHKVECAEDGKKAIEIVEAGHVDIVITDILMPDMDGYELIAALRKRPDPPRIVAMTGGSGLLDMEYLLTMARGMRADWLLQKPLNLKMVEAAIEELLGEAPASSPAAD